MNELVLEQTIFKKTKLTNAIINEINFKNKIIEEGFADILNYGVSTRAVDLQFGGKEKLEEYVKQELLKNINLSIFLNWIQKKFRRQ